ncbi:MAG: hypothetical protein EBV06_07905 [Planctomycetia bacterium]|nr:hypothetical protein [Planctomycetia bacterium]
MLQLILPESSMSHQTLNRFALRAVRPALNDLRFKGDADVVTRDEGVAICIGNYELTQVECTSLDHPSLYRAFNAIRVGQARRNIAKK